LNFLKNESIEIIESNLIGRKILKIIKESDKLKIIMIFFDKSRKNFKISSRVWTILNTAMMIKIVMTDVSMFSMFYLI